MTLGGDYGAFAGFALRIILAVVLGFAAGAAPAQSYDPGAIAAFTVKFSADVAPDATSALPDSVRAELLDALQLPFVQTGSTRDGAFRLELTNPLSLDQARALVNRVRMLPDVLYASIETAPGASAGATQRKAAAQGPLVRRMIVKYKDPAVSGDAAANRPLSPGLVARLSTLAGQPVAHDHPMSAGAFVVRLFQGLPPGQAESLAKLLETDPAIDYAEPDYLRQIAFVPNDTYYSTSQWDLQSPPAEMGSVDLPAAWDLTTGSSSIVVGIIDTGILPHPDLTGRYLAGYDMIVDPLVANDNDPSSCTSPGTCSSRDANPTDPGDWVTSTESASGYFQGCPVTNSSFHGTHVSGTIGAASNNGTGVAGINWVSKILPVRVLGKCGGYTSDIDDAIVWASGGSVPGVPANPNPARVLNLSLGGTGPCDTATQSAINTALAAGTVVVVAAGNSNSRRLRLHACELQRRDHRGRDRTPGPARELQQLWRDGRDLRTRRQRRLRDSVDAEQRHDLAQSFGVRLRALSGHQHGDAARDGHRVADAVARPLADTGAGAGDDPDYGARVPDRNGPRLHDGALRSGHRRRRGGPARAGVVVAVDDDVGEFAQSGKRRNHRHFHRHRHRHQPHRHRRPQPMAAARFPAAPALRSPATAAPPPPPAPPAASPPAPTASSPATAAMPPTLLRVALRCRS